MNVSMVALDTAKAVMQVHGVNEEGRAELRRKLRRGEVVTFFTELPACTVVLEACGAAHHWGRVLGALGHTRSDGENFVTYERDSAEEEDDTAMWFGFTVDSHMLPGSTRVALAAESCEEVDRLTTVILEAGAQNVEGPEYAYGPDYYAVFFDDPDGNKLEVCCYGPRAQAAG